MGNKTNKSFWQRVMRLAVLLFFVFSLFSSGSSQAATNCGDVNSYLAPQLTAQATSKGVELTWSKIDDSRFSSYYIVISRNNSKPAYSADGYLDIINDAAVVSYVVDNSKNYQGGDFISPLQAGEYYYFAISVKYDCGLVKTSNVVQVKFPDLNPPELIQPRIGAIVKDDGSILLSWDKIDHQYLKEYRVVISNLDPNPNYPDNGYLKVISTTDSNSLLIDNSLQYSGGDFGGYLERGKGYYFAVTAVYSINDKEYYSTSDAIRLIYNGPTGNPTNFLPIPTITKITSNSEGVNVQWDKINDNRLVGFYIVIGKNYLPVFPSSGYIAFVDKDSTSYLINNSIPYKKGNFGEYLEYGEKYYFSVVAEYKGGYYRSAAVYQQTYVGPLPPTDKYLQLKAYSTPGGIILNWNRINDSRLYGYKVVISSTKENPRYPDDGWYLDVVNDRGEFDRNIGSVIIKGDRENNKGDFTKLEKGKKYYVVLVGLLKDGKYIHSNAVEVEYQGDQGSLFPGNDDKNKELDQFVEEEKQMVKSVDNNLVNRLKGRILLQVENKGEAWYVDPVSAKKYYLRDPQTAFAALRQFGLGISNSDLAKIPVGIEDRFVDKDSDNDGLADKLEEGLGTDPNNPDSDGDGFSDGEEVKNGFNPLGSGKIAVDNNLVNRLKGRILLQVENRGQAWYVNPADGKRYYLKDGQAAYDIMRFLSLGITNNDLRKIAVGDL